MEDAHECVRLLIFPTYVCVSHLPKPSRNGKMELPVFSKNHRPARIVWHDIVPVAAFALALLLTLLTNQYSDMLPTHWSIDHREATYQRESTAIPKHRQWTTVWPTVVRFDRPVI
jgi:hypothetical protein